MDSLLDLRPERPGYRLHRLEVYNWGTFDSTGGQVYSVQPEGRTTLLVGQNGSGKSTLVDALLTLLVPSSIRNYNVAAGAKKTERSEKSYLRGACGRASDAAQSAVTKYLRPSGKHFSAVLGVFRDEELGRSFTLCQVLHLSGDGGVEKTYAIADEERALATDLSGLTRAEQVRPRLAECGYRTTKTYVEYSQWFARRTGVRGKAMDMFNQTVAVKDIQSLNEFIRRHMLEAHDWREKVQRLLAHFAELSAAHRELLRVRLAQELLEPVEKLGNKYRKRAERLETTERLLSAADTYFPSQAVRLYEPELRRCQRRLSEAVEEKQRLAARIATSGEDVRRLKNEIEQAGGERLRMLPVLISREQAALEPKRREWARFHGHARQCGLPETVNTRAAFDQIVERLNELSREAKAKMTAATARQEELIGERGQVQRELREERAELEILTRRQTNLPGHLATLRGRVCEDLGLAESELPFAAELIAVRSDQRAWEASAEMVLRSFALSLLVPERFYRRVRSYVEQTKMVDGRGQGQRLVYLCVKRSVSDNGDRQHPQSLLRKLEFRAGHDLAPWVRGEVERRFDYQCCELVEEFDHAPRFAMTANRHIKTGSDRHEKDDRPRSVDPRHFVLGWDNREKRRRLAERIGQLEAQIARFDTQVAALVGQAERNREIVAAAQAARETADFDAIDINRHIAEIAALEQEKAELESSNDAVVALRARLRAAEDEIVQLQAERDEAVGVERELRKTIQQGEELMRVAARQLENAQLAGTLESDREVYAALDERLANPPLTVETLFAREQQFRSAAAGEILRMREEIDPLKERLLGAMGRYLRDFKAERDDLDARVDSLSSFMQLLNQIRREDLPRHEQRFKERLNDKVSQEVALFYASLRNEGKQIEEKIEQLNQALGELEYHPGTFMRLEPRPVSDREINDFKRSLRECLDDSLDNSDAANEARFVRIEKLVNRLADTEKTRWRDKVIDVRRWYDFAAREVHRESGETQSYYEDSSGQSGGEKAKLAFTILVAAIAYQYDLDPSGRTPGRFHFVCVDEMFSKIDDRYAEYALRLFEQFGLQLLIVAPLDAKARVTEPFVDCYLHVVKDESTSRSQIFSMTAREYEEVAGAFGDFAATSSGGANGDMARLAREKSKLK